MLLLLLLLLLLSSSAFRVHSPMQCLQSSSLSLPCAVISPHAMSVEDIMRAKRTDGSQAVPTGLVGQPAPSKPKSLFERKMAKMHARQREWEEKMKLMQASAQDEAGQQGGAPPTK